MPNTLQHYIDSLDEAGREKVDRLKAQFLANEEDHRSRPGAATPLAPDSPSGPPLAASPSRRQ